MLVQMSVHRSFLTSTSDTSNRICIAPKFIYLPQNIFSIVEKQHLISYMIEAIDQNAVIEHCLNTPGQRYIERSRAWCFRLN